MSRKKSDTKTETGIWRTLGNDVRSGGHFHIIRREYRGLRDFYLDREMKVRLQKMNPVKKRLFIAWWLLKSMFFKLTPTRRLLLLIGVIFSNGGFKISFGKVVINDNSFLGGILILFVLLLELKDKLTAHGELESGRSIQEALAPEQSPSIPGWSLWLFTRPAREVGGDLVDFLQTSPERSGFVMADIAGKGLRAALFAAKLQATVRALASDYDSLSELCSKVNTIFHRDSLPSIFASLFYIEVRQDSGAIRFVNAGHMPPLLLSQQRCKELPRGDLALGLSEKIEYTEQTLELQSGEVLFVYSDGLTEAGDESGEFYGMDRLTRLLSENGHLDAPHLGELVTKQLDQFVGEARNNDDLSLLILKKL